MPDFSEDWFDWHKPHWERFFVGLAWDPEAPHTAVEIGSFEGRSTVWILQNLLRHPESRLFCLDTFEGGAEHHPGQTEGLFDRFRANLAGAGVAERAEVLRGPSFDGLAGLVARGVAADFVYVDGSHDAPDVLADLVLSFRLLRPGGVMICDDYFWSREPQAEQDILNSPKLAIDAFTNIYRRRLEFPEGLQRWQLGLRKVPA